MRSLLFLLLMLITCPAAERVIHLFVASSPFPIFGGTR